MGELGPFQITAGEILICVKMTTDSEIYRMDTVKLAAHLRSRDLSPVEIIEAVLSRMEHPEPQLHAFCTPTPDLARAGAKGGVRLVFIEPPGLGPGIFVRALVLERAVDR